MLRPEKASAAVVNVGGGDGSKHAVFFTILPFPNGSKNPACENPINENIDLQVSTYSRSRIVIT